MSIISRVVARINISDFVSFEARIRQLFIVCREVVNGKKYSLHAVVEMVETSCKVEPPGSSCRRGLQTAQRCFGKEP